MVRGGLNVNPTIDYGGMTGPNVRGFSPYYSRPGPCQWMSTPRPVYGGLPKSQTDPTCIDGIGHFMDVNW